MSSDSDADSRLHRLKRIYDPEIFRRAALKLGEQLSGFLERALEEGGPSLGWSPPDRLVSLATAALGQRSASTGDWADPLAVLTGQFLAECHRLHSPHYMGHQVPPPIPATALFEGAGGLANQGSAVYEMGPFSTACERAVVAELARRVWGARGGDGIGTHGGSLANLTALLAARNAFFGESWTKGLAGGKRPAVLTGSDTHYSVARAAGILGIGTDQVIKVRLDERRRLRAGAAEEALARATKDGLTPFAIVGSACSTPIGAFDPLDELGELAERHGLWFHVDGAHGASVLFSRRYKERVKGIRSARSVTWDAHKMLYTPALSTFLLFRDPADSYVAFQQEAPYLFDPEAAQLSRYDSALRTVECTKRALAMGLWGAWSLFGPELFEDLVDATFVLAERFHRLVARTPDFEVLHRPEANILCFRHRPRWLGIADEEVSRFQQALRRRLVETGSYYITATRLDGVMALRVTLMNPFTGESHLEGLLAELRAIGEGLRC